MAISVTVSRKRIENKYYSGSSFVVTGGTGVAIHREFGRLLGVTDLSSRTVAVVFSSPFKIKPFGWVEVYRMTSKNGMWRKVNVLYQHNTEDWLDTAGFELVIDATESLTGVILEYYYTE